MPHWKSVNLSGRLGNWIVIFSRRTKKLNIVKRVKKAAFNDDYFMLIFQIFGQAHITSSAVEEVFLSAYPT